MRGKDRVTSRVGLVFSVLLVSLVFYFILLRTVQIVSYDGFVTRESIAESQAIRDKLVNDISDLLGKMAFRAVKFQTDTVLDSNLAEWQGFLVKSNHREASIREKLPIRTCTSEDFKRFPAARSDIKNKYEEYVAR